MTAPRIEFRVKGMTYRTAAGERTEASSPISVPPVETEESALELAQSIQRARGGIVQRREVTETPWEDIP